MKNQALFSSKDKSKKVKCHLLQFLFGALRVKKGAVEVQLKGSCCSRNPITSIILEQTDLP